MKLIFHPTNNLKEYDAYDVQPKACSDGQVIDVPAHRVQRLIEVYPRNFEEPGPPQAPSKKTVVRRVPPLKKIVPPTPSSKEYRPPLRKELSLADITIIVINPYPDVFKNHFLPCIPPEAEFMPLENINNIYWTSGPKALNEAIGAASNEIVMCAHPDLVLGKKWWDNFIYHEARLENWGALGISGWDHNNNITWGNHLLLPGEVQCLDENCLILNRKNNIKFDEARFTSWHCYAADYCLQCHDRGLGVYLVPGVAFHEGHSFSEVPGFMQQRDETLPILWKKWRGKVSSINMGLKQSKIRGEK